MILLGGFIGGALWLQEKYTESAFRSRLSASQELFQESLSADTRTLAAVATTILHDETMLSLWAQADKEVLRKYATPIAEELRTNYAITHFYFHNLDCTNFLRVHDPKRFGDTIKRYTLQHTAETGEPTSGIEMGPLGTFTLRLVHPSSLHGVPVGYLELGIDVKQLTTTMRKVLDINALILIDKPYLNRTAWESRMEKNGVSADWDLLADAAIVDCTFAKPPEVLLNALKDRLLTPQRPGQELELEGVPCLTAMMPLQDASGRRLGWMVVCNDISADRARLFHMLAVLSVLGCILAGTKLSLAWFYLGRIEIRLDTFHRQALAESQAREIAKESHIKDMQAEREALHESEERFRSITVAAQDAIITIDSHGRITFWNEAATRIFGYSCKEAIEDNIGWKMLPSRYHRTFRSLLRGFRATGHSPIIDKKFRTILRCKDLILLPVELSVSTLQLKGEWHVMSIVRDITHQKQAEDALRRQALALEKANIAAMAATRAKSEFLANMSHEIRTPMTAILGYTDLLVEEHKEASTSQYLLPIKQNGQHLLQIINDILDLSKIEAGKATVEQFRCSPAEVLAEVRSMMQARAAAKGIVWSVEHLGQIPAHIRTDPVRFRQILLNLVGNAMKFTDVGSVRLTIQAVGGDNPQLECNVYDTGIGMTAAQAALLFKPFSQADSSMTRRFGGTGLGLAISKALAERLGGTLVLVATQPGVGSQFQFTLPITLLQTEADAAIPAVPATGLISSIPFPAGLPRLVCRVLLAEDGPDNQRLIRILLEKAGAQVTVVENGQLALAVFSTAQETDSPFDIILMDMQMPVLDGYEATQRLRQLGFTHPVLALTAHAMVEDRQKCLSAGCDDFLTKPIDRRTLLWTIAKHITARSEAIEMKQENVAS